MTSEEFLALNERITQLLASYNFDILMFLDLKFKIRRNGKSYYFKLLKGKYDLKEMTVWIAKDEVPECDESSCIDVTEIFKSDKEKDKYLWHSEIFCLPI